MSTINKMNSKLLVKFWGVFLYSSLVVAAFIGIFFKFEYDEKHRLAQFYGYIFSEEISNQFYELARDVMPLYTLISINKDEAGSFYSTAQKILISRPEIIALNLAKNGIVSHVFPYEENKKAIGHNLLQDEARKVEALRAKDTQKITVSGPFHLRQGGVGLAFRQPIYLYPNDKEEVFWGFAIAIYRFPEIIKKGVNFTILSNAGFNWELWRKDPANGKRLSLLSSGTLDKDFRRFQINLQNATWWIDIAPINGFINYRKLFVVVAASLVFCLLLSFIFTYFSSIVNRYNNIKSKIHIDDLTGLYNKKYFWEKIEPALEKHFAYSYTEEDPQLFICVMDINKFKSINDTYGHVVGDKILIEFSERLSKELTANEFASRFGGDEFVAVFYCRGQNGQSLPERIQHIKRHLEGLYYVNGSKLDVSVSLGALSPQKHMLAEKPPSLSMGEFFLEQVDKIMYSEKYSFHEKNSAR